MSAAQLKQNQPSHFSTAKWWILAANEDLRVDNCSRVIDTSAILGGRNNVITQRTYDATNGVIQTIKTGPTASPTKFQDWSYQFDSEGNLYRRKSTRNVSGSAENIQEDFTYDSLYRLQTAARSGNVSCAPNCNISYGYDALGNLTSRSDIPGTRLYDQSTGGGVHALSKVGAASYNYDAKGNMTSNGTRTLVYTVDNNPSSIVDSATTNSIAFQYDVHGCTSVAGAGCARATGPDRQRIYQHASTTLGTSPPSTITTDTKYYENEFEVVTRNGQKVRDKTYIGNFMVLTKVYLAGGVGYSADLSYLHKDHLGSTDAITTGHSTGSGTGATEEGRMLFDPFGKRRKDNGADEDADEDATYKATLANKTFETTTKGYTGHEQLDSVGLIHMGGRVYDPYIGRFLSPDEHVQYPEFTQSYNRYSYVLNNPLSSVDPTGEEESKDLPLGAAKNDDGSITYSKGTKYEWTQGIDGNARLTGAGKENRTPEPVAEGGGDENTQGEQINTDMRRPLTNYRKNVEEAMKDAAKIAVSAVVAVAVEVGLVEARAAKAIQEIKFFRGAKYGEEPSFTPRANEIKVDSSTGIVSPTHGVSIFDNAKSVESKGYVPHEIDTNSIPDSLQIIQRGKDPSHFEITPKPDANLTVDQFKEAVCSINCK